MPDNKYSEYLFAAVGSLCKDGGRITPVSTTATIDEKNLVGGDVVTCEDATETTIFDGAGVVATWSNEPVALVGSRLSNDDRIISAPKDSLDVTGRYGEDIAGLFDPSYGPPEQIEAKGGGDRHA